MMSVKKICILLIIFMSGVTHAVKPIVVSKKMYGEDWPFKRQEMMIECRHGSQLFAISEGTLARYALNNEAYEATKSLKTFIPIEDALKESSSDAGSKMDYSIIVEKAQTLCK